MTFLASNSDFTIAEKEWIIKILLLSFSLRLPHYIMRKIPIQAWCLHQGLRVWDADVRKIGSQTRIQIVLDLQSFVWQQRYNSSGKKQKRITTISCTYDCHSILLIAWWKFWHLAAGMYLQRLWYPGAVWSLFATFTKSKGEARFA